MLTRRNFIKGFGASAAVLACSSVYASTNNTEVELNQFEVQVRDLPKEFNDYRIAFVSDLHAGPFLPEEWLVASFDILKQNKFDLLILGGDYINIQESKKKNSIYPKRSKRYKDLTHKKHAIEIYKSICKLYSEIKAKDGTLAVFGNHDRWLAPIECVKSFKENKINFLVNTYHSIKRGKAQIDFFGADDFWTGVPSLRRLDKESKATKVLISHNPDYISQLLKHKKDYFALTLSGHTHGGQIRLPLIGGLYYNVEDLRFIEGLASVETAQVFTSRGVGVVEVPYRLNCPPEINILTLKA